MHFTPLNQKKKKKNTDMGFRAVSKEDFIYCFKINNNKKMHTQSRNTLLPLASAIMQRPHKWRQLAHSRILRESPHPARWSTGSFDLGPAGLCNSDKAKDNNKSIFQKSSSVSSQLILRATPWPTFSSRSKHSYLSILLKTTHTSLSKHSPRPIVL